MLTLTNEMMRAIIMDHYSNPQNKHQPSKEGYEMMHMHSENCIDDINVYLLIENSVVKDACFDGVACTISTASTDIMCDLLKGKKIEEAKLKVKESEDYALQADKKAPMKTKLEGIEDEDAVLLEEDDYEDPSKAQADLPETVREVIGDDAK